MTNTTTRRTAIATLGAGAAGITLGTLLPTRSAIAAISSGAGIVAGGSIDGSSGPIQFSAFGTRLQYDDGLEPTMHAAFSWFDPMGAEESPLSLTLVSVGSYGPGDQDNVRMIAGTVSVNGADEAPFVLWLVDNGDIGTAADSIRLVVGPAAIELMGTPTAATPVTDFAYDLEGDLTAGNIQLIDLF